MLTPIWSETPETASRLRGRIEAGLGVGPGRHGHMCASNWPSRSSDGYAGDHPFVFEGDRPRRGSEQHGPAHAAQTASRSGAPRTGSGARSGRGAPTRASPFEVAEGLPSRIRRRRWSRRISAVRWSRGAVQSMERLGRSMSAARRRRTSSHSARRDDPHRPHRRRLRRDQGGVAAGAASVRSASAPNRRLFSSGLAINRRRGALASCSPHWTVVHIWPARLG